MTRLQCARYAPITNKRTDDRPHRSAAEFTCNNIYFLRMYAIEMNPQNSSTINKKFYMIKKHIRKG